MKKVAILTINDDGNYGNRLQNYAVQEVLKKYNLCVETVNNQKGNVGIKIFINKIKKIIKQLFFTSKYRRANMFYRFNKYINYSKFYIDENHISKKLNNNYDIFFTGSDQVWNPNFNRMSDIDFLTFADINKRNSISASFGISLIPDNLKDYYKRRLMEFNNISVREEQGKKIVESLTGRKDIEVLIDPTMLLTSMEWDKILKKPKKIRNRKYILNYFLGELSIERITEIKRIANKYNCEIINILDANDPMYISGPSEFLWLEKNAFLICTDSFHSCVFAILYDRPFIVFERNDKEENMNSRINTLISKFKLKNREYNENKITEKNIEHDYSEAYKILELERTKSDMFIRKVLEIKE